MNYAISLYEDHRGWKLIEGRCAAGVPGAWRYKQCSRKESVRATVHCYDGARCGTDVHDVPLCLQHASARNVSEVKVNA